MSTTNENHIENVNCQKENKINCNTDDDGTTAVPMVDPIERLANIDINMIAPTMVSGNPKTESGESRAASSASQVHEQATQLQNISVHQQSIAQTTQQELQKDKMDVDATLTNFKVLYVVTQLCGLTMIVLIGSWIGVHLGGLGSENPKLEFNWHPLLMTIGLIYLYGNSILVYRGFRNMRKKTLKLAHASIHMAAFILTVIALKTVFDSHNLAVPPIPNMYSLHSWLGIFAVLVFCLQYVAGFVAYLAPGMRDSFKVAYMPLHIYFGLFGFVLAIASALMGITEKAIFSIPNYASLPNSGVTANMCGILFVIFGSLVVYLTTDGTYKRNPLPEDAVLLTGVHE